MNGEKKEPILLAVIIAVSILLFLFSGKKAERLSEYDIKKGNPGEGIKKYSFQATVEDCYLEDVSIEVPERNYTNEECEELSKKCREEVLRKMLGKNYDLRNITEDLCFFEELEGYPFSYAFLTDKPEKIGSSGEILVTDGFTAKVIVKYAYEDFFDSFSIKIKVNPGLFVKQRIYEKEILAEVKKESETDSVSLPQNIDGKKVQYSLAGERRNPVFLLLGVVACVGVMYGKRVETRKKKHQIKEEIIDEYPVVLQKMSMYLASGMTIRSIWQAIYEEGVKKKGKEAPFYMQMGISINELKSGISEGLSYTRFGERTQVMEIVRFTALLSQNLKKGSSKLKDLLDEESGKAFMEKKQRAVKKGEQAGTKLLLPMMILLIDVLIIIMVPAFWTM